MPTGYDVASECSTPVGHTAAAVEALAALMGSTDVGRPGTVGTSSKAAALASASTAAVTPPAMACAWVTQPRPLPCHAVHYGKGVAQALIFAVPQRMTIIGVSRSVCTYFCCMARAGKSPCRRQSAASHGPHLMHHAAGCRRFLLPRLAAASSKPTVAATKRCSGGGGRIVYRGVAIGVPRTLASPRRPQPPESAVG